jgi:PadR family transcriptional regulator, regulatory protein PadR
LYTYVNKGYEVSVAGSDLFTGTLDLLVLKAVSWGPRHGYAIGRWIRETTSEDVIVNEGVLYPALHRLERRGWLAEQWGVTDTGREAKYYSLTGDGRAQLRAETKRWSRFSSAVSKALTSSPA